MSTDASAAPAVTCVARTGNVELKVQTLEPLAPWPAEPATLSFNGGCQQKYCTVTTGTGLISNVWHISECGVDRMKGQFSRPPGAQFCNSGVISWSWESPQHR